jgi:hypothetical protein
LSHRTPRRALDAALDALRLVTSCVSRQPLAAIRHPNDPQRYSLVFMPLHTPATLRSERSPRTVRVQIRHDCAVARSADSDDGFAATTVTYDYRVLDREQNELLAYHWHPAGVSSVRHPHIHLSSQIRPLTLGRDDAELPLADLHVASGVVPLAHIVRKLIEEFGVEPLRDDWAAVLPV